MVIFLHKTFTYNLNLLVLLKFIKTDQKISDFDLLVRSEDGQGQKFIPPNDVDIPPDAILNPFSSFLNLRTLAFEHYGTRGYPLCAWGGRFCFF